MTKHRSTLTAWGVVALLVMANAAYAQGVAVFASVDGKTCPTGFVTGGGKCDATKSMTKGYIGYVGNGKCAKGYTVSGVYCSIRVEEEKGSAKSSKSSSSSSMPDPTPDQTFARLAITARLKKAAETDLCPTGYFTNRQDISQCVTHYSEAPKSRLATGGKCSAGETLERGKYCSGATTMTPSEMNSAMTADFNDLYTMLSVKSGSAPNLSSAEPEIFAATAGQRQAAKSKEAADTKAKADADAPKQLGSYDPNCAAYLPNIAGANACQQMILDTRAHQAALGIAPPGGMSPAAAAAAIPADALKQGLKGLFGK